MAKDYKAGKMIGRYVEAVLGAWKTLPTNSSFPQISDALAHYMLFYNFSCTCKVPDPYLQLSSTQTTTTSAPLRGGGAWGQPTISQNTPYVELED